MELQKVIDIIDLASALKKTLSALEQCKAKCEASDAELAALRLAIKNSKKPDKALEKKLDKAEAARVKLDAEAATLTATATAQTEKLAAQVAAVGTEPTGTVSFDLGSVQDKFTQTQDALAETRTALKIQRELLPPIDARMARLRLERPTTEIKQELLALDKRRTLIVAEITRLENQQLSLMATAMSLLTDFLVKADQRSLVEQLNDDIPFLLLPVRLETRFMILKHVQRIAPVSGGKGDVLPLLEVSTEYQMPKVMPLQQSPRRVEDTYELWIRIYPDDIEIQTHEDRLSQDEYDSALSYWTQVWRAGNDSNLELGAWRVLCNSYGPRRAAWVAKQTEPTNPGDKPGTPVPEPTPLPFVPVLPTLSLKPAAWTELPHTRVMPDAFVARIYTGNTYREVMGKPVPDPLPVGLDPTADYTSLLDQVSGVINMPADIKWISDFEEAVKVGMGIRIPISATEMDNGFDRLLVLGLRLRSDASASKTQLENLLNGHHYKTGFALLPQGTPTNNTDTLPAGFSSTEPGEETSFAVERQGALYTTDTNHAAKKDGQRFAEALGISDSVMEHVYHSNGTDGKESICMNKALWPATLGYYMKQMLTPSASNTDISNTKNFFTNYVHGRGLVPAFRIGKQPYGIHPATVYSRWKYSNTNSYQSKLYNNILKPLDNIIGSLVPNVASVTTLKNNSSLDAKTTLVNMLGLHPSSVEYHQRFTAGSYLMWNIQRFVAGKSIALDPNFPIIDDTKEINNDNIFSNTLQFQYMNIPRILSMTFLEQHRLLNGPVIDNLPLSETRTIQNIPATVKNYIEWLGLSTLQQVRTENFTNIGAAATQKPPQALLYLLLRHACFLEYLNVSYNILLDANVIAAEATIDNELLNIVSADQNVLSEEVVATLRTTVEAELTAANEMRIQAEVTRLLGDTGMATEKTRSSFEEQLRQVTAAEVNMVVERVFNQRLRELQVDQAKWNYLTQPVPEVSGEMAMEDYISVLMDKDAVATQSLIELKAALNCISLLPTARLERTMSEHLDCCSYRLDAWMTGLVTDRLSTQRALRPEGIYLGAYSMLEEVRPGSFPGIHVEEVVVRTATATVLTAADVSAAITAAAKKTTEQPAAKGPAAGEQLLPPLSIEYAKPLTFTYLGSDPFTQLIEDPLSGKIIAAPRINPENEGFILAPSLNHAVTAAILRAGYVAHKNTTSNDDALAVNLTSARVRKAMYYLEGIRHGNSLNALLGYQFERLLHTMYAGTGTYTLDQFILDIRLEYPLVTGSVVADPSVNNIDDSEARNVTDGLALIEAYRKTTPAWDANLSALNANATAHSDVVTAIGMIMNDLDAIGDLLLSESVFQVARGNHERAGAVIKAMGEGNNIPEPEIVKTPRTNNVLTHKFAVQFNPATAPDYIWSTAATPRSYSEPALNAWIAQQLPAPAKIMARVEYTDNSNTLQVYNVTMTDLEIEPIDLVYIYANGGDSNTATAAEMSSRIILFVKQTFGLNETNAVQVYFRDRTGFAPDERNLFELYPLLRGLSTMISSSRELRAEDLLLPGQVSSILAASAAGVDTTNLLIRLTDALGPAVTPGRRGIQDVLVALAAAEGAAAALSYPPVPVGAAAVLNTLRNEIKAGAGFGIDAAVPQTANDDSEQTRDQLLYQSKVVRAELQRRHTRAQAKFTALAAVTDERDRAKRLIEIAQIIFGRSFKVYPEFTLHNTGDYNLSLGNSSLQASAAPILIDEWMHGISRVRKPMNGYRKLMLVAESVTARDFTTHKVVQLPLHAAGTDKWLGLEIPAGYEVAGDTLSLVMELPAGYNAAQPQAGILLDEWTEAIPDPNVTTGIAMNYDDPNNEAPQSLLLAVTPEIKGRWLWNDLMDTLNETLDMAKKRAVEPDMIQQTILSQVLPAIMAPVNGTSAAPGLDFGRNIVQAPAGQNGPIVMANYVQQTIDDTNLSPS
jgi:hypothetical protein